MKKINFIPALIIFFSLFQTEISLGQIPDLFKITERKGTATSKNEIALVKAINVVPNIKLLLTSDIKRLNVLLPSGERIIINKKRDENPDQKHKIWIGEVEKYPGSLVMFSISTNVMTGHIEVNGKYYRISYLGNRVHQIAELDLKQYKDGDDDFKEFNYEKQTSNEDGCPDPSADIDIMVVYTADARIGAGGADGMESLIYESIALTNLSYFNSNITQRLRLVHFEEVSYVESINSVIDLDRITNPSDGFMDNVQTLRNTFGADIVVLFSEQLEPGNAGRANLMGTVSAAHSANAFAVARRDQVVSNKTFPHEVAHVMGARHSCDGSGPDTSLNPFPFGHGFHQATPADGSGLAWRTIMDKNSACCQRIAFFSNPSINFSPTGNLTLTNPMGQPTGPCQSDNHQVLNNTASTVANFMCSSPSINNVWMKDTWNDTGAEPDSHTASENMWKSPYIWVRNQNDGVANQHIHQNPEFGQSNWVYVKMHNGSSAPQSGNLKIYIANASVSLVWPGSWTQISTIPVTLPGSSSSIQQFEWTTVPSPSPSSHFCMIARWESATDPMHVPEGTDINVNVRQNNNIIWRNMNIVDVADGDSKISFEVTNPTKMKNKIEFSDETLFPKTPFVGNGVVDIILDEKLYEYLKKSRAIISGLEKVEGTTFRMIAKKASFDNIIIPADFKGVVTIIFKKTENTPINNSNFSIKQFVKTDMVSKVKLPKYRILGGIDYEIQNFNK
jgi:hypothetical protein